MLEIDNLVNDVDVNANLKTLKDYEEMNLD